MRDNFWEQGNLTRVNFREHLNLFLGNKLREKLQFFLAEQGNMHPPPPGASLVRILQPISTSQFTIKDSFSFADWAKTFNHNNEIMCSFDVSSLFTNVPLDETIQICLDKLYALPDPPTLPRSVLKVLLEFATKRSHFIFNG